MLLLGDAKNAAAIAPQNVASIPLDVSTEDFLSDIGLWQKAARSHILQDMKMFDQRKPWTPGPWKVGLGRTILTQNFIDPDQPERGVQIICGGVMEEDARLIAAAPDMADLLERFNDWASQPKGWFNDEDGAHKLLHDARALLAKIKGD